MERKRKIEQLMLYLTITIVCSIMVFPFLWMIATSFKTGVDVYNISLIPENPTIQNYVKVWNDSKFPRWFFNSFVVSIVTVISVLFFDSIVGYTFAKLKFRGRKPLFITILSTLMVPTEMLIIPWFLLINKFGWVNSYWSILFPGLVSAFGIFLMRQFFMGIPDELLDAGRIDGLSEFGVFWHIAIPLVKPALSALAIFTFLASWNAFLWPVIAIDDPNMYTLPVGVALFSSEVLNEWDLIMTGASIATVPVIIVFLIFQKKIIEGIQLAGLKG